MLKQAQHDDLATSPQTLVAPAQAGVHPRYPFRDTLVAIGPGLRRGDGDVGVTAR